MSDLYGEALPVIAPDLRRRVLIEAGHRCAVPACRSIDVEIHPIVPWSIGRLDAYENLIALCPSCQRRAHSDEIAPEALRLYKLNLRFAHDKYSQLEMDMLFELYRAPRGAGAPWTAFMLVFFKRLFDSGFVDLIRRPNLSLSGAGAETAPTFLTITQTGRDFIQNLERHEL